MICLAQRLRRAAEIEALGFRPYGQRFDFTHTVPQILASKREDGGRAGGQTAGSHRRAHQTIRRMGKAGLHAPDAIRRAPAGLLRKDAVSEKEYKLYKMLDPGDIVGVDGYLFRTRTGELSVHAKKLDIPVQDSADHAGKMAWPGGCRNPLPPALSGFDRESGIAEDVRDARADYRVSAARNWRRAASSRWRRL